MLAEGFGDVYRDYGMHFQTPEIRREEFEAALYVEGLKLQRSMGFISTMGEDITELIKKARKTQCR